MSTQVGEEAARKYTSTNQSPAETEPSVSWWRKPIGWLKTYSKELGAFASVLVIVNTGVILIAKLWGLGQKNIPEAKRLENVA